MNAEDLRDKISDIDEARRDLAQFAEETLRQFRLENDFYMYEHAGKSYLAADKALKLERAQALLELCLLLPDACRALQL